MGVNWLYISINLFGGVNLIGSYLITFVMVIILSFFPAITGYITTRYFQSSSRIVLLFLIPALWTLFEWSRTWVLTGFPWLSIGYTQTDTVLSAYAPVSGVFGISFLVALIAASIVLLIQGIFKEKILSLITIISIIFIAFIIQPINWTKEKEKFFKVAMIQGGIPQELKWTKEYKQKTIDLYSSLSSQFWGYDLIIWPETAMPFFYHDEKPFINALRNKAIKTKTGLLLGIPYREPNAADYYNTVVALGKTTGVYRKKHLVPFGEYLPFNSITRPVLHFLKIPMSDFSKGDQMKPLLNIADEKIGISICYEDVYGGEVVQALPEASLLVNVSNDAWFGDSSAPHQHLQMARMRSIETGRYMLRATNNGISAIIDHKGRIVEKSPQFKSYALSGEAKLFIGNTLYARTGNYGIIAPLFILLIVSFLKGRNSNLSKAS